MTCQSPCSGCAKPTCDQHQPLSEAPAKGAAYYLPDVLLQAATQQSWRHDAADLQYLQKGLAYATEEGALARMRFMTTAEPAGRVESVLIDGVAYTIPAAVAGEMLRLHMEIQGARLALPGLGNLWCVNVLGPDDVHAMPDRETALVRANELNIAWSQRAHHPNDPMLFAVVVEWPGTAESHAAALSATPQPSMRDPYTDLMAEQAMSINREQLRRALSWMGVSTGDSSDEGFAASISVHVNRLTDVIQTMREERLARVPVPPASAAALYSLDMDPDGIRARAADAITGALAFGAQGTNPAPAGHWLAPFWEMARATANPAIIAPAEDLEGDARQAHDQCRAVVYMAEALASVYRAQATLLEGGHMAPEITGPRSAAAMEWLGDELNGMDAVTDGDTWMAEIFARAQKRWGADESSPSESGAGRGSPKYIYQLADHVDADELWTLSGMAQLRLPPDKLRQLDAGVYLRRYAALVERVRNLLGVGRALQITPLSVNGWAFDVVDAPERYAKYIAANKEGSEA